MDQRIYHLARDNLSGFSAFSTASDTRYVCGSSGGRHIMVSARPATGLYIVTADGKYVSAGLPADRVLGVLEAMFRGEKVPVTSLTRVVAAGANTPVAE